MMGGGMEKQVLEIREFSQALGVHPATVRRLIDSGVVKILRIATRVMIPKGELERALTEGLPRGRDAAGARRPAKPARAK